MNKMATMFLTVTALAFATPAFAQDCEITTSEPEAAAAGFYVDNDPCQPECLFSIWVYQESNNMDGLQRNDDWKDDTCGGQIDSDTIIL